MGLLYLYLYIIITINVIILILFSKIYYLKTDSGFVKYVGYTGNLQVLQCRYGINLTLSQHYANHM